MSVAYTLVLNAAVATLVLALAAVGLAVIFGMMNVINLAHGAFITGGAYVAWVAANAGSFWVGVIAAPIVLGVVGYVLEWAVVGRLYDRPLDTILATWGIALAAQEGLKLLFDATSKDVPLPIQGRVDLGAHRLSNLPAGSYWDECSGIDGRVCGVALDEIWRSASCRHPGPNSSESVGTQRNTAVPDHVRVRGRARGTSRRSVITYRNGHA